MTKSAILKSQTRKLAELSADGQRIGEVDARIMLERCADSFRQARVSDKIIERLFEHLDFIPDTRIITACRKVVKALLDDSECYYAPLGGHNESSFRIVSSINNDPNFCPDINTALRRAKEAPLPIVMFDDFLNTGGQFERIIKGWIDAPQITDLDELRKTRLVFIFYQGMESGRISAKKSLRNARIDGQVSVVNQYDDDSGIFGQRKNVDALRFGTLNMSSGIFKGCAVNEVKHFLHVCEKAGDALLRLHHPEWDEDKIRSRLLGYGNSAKLFIGQNNIPTCTLTVLWLSGEICLEGNKINWLSLIERRSKVTKTPEMPPPFQCNVLQNITLDAESGKDVNMEATLVYNLKRFDDRLLSPFSPALPIQLRRFFYDDFFNHIASPEFPMLRRYLPAQYSTKVNNHLRVILDNVPYRAKVQSVEVVSFPRSHYLLVGKFKFYLDALPLEKVAAIFHALRIGAKINFYADDNRCNYQSAAALLSTAVPDFLEISSSYPERLLGFARCALRENIGTTDMERAFLLLGKFDNPKNSVNLPIDQLRTLLHRVMDYDAWISVSRFGTLIFCGSNPGVNRSFLQNEFAAALLHNELLAGLIRRLLIASRESFSPTDAEQFLIDHWGKEDWGAFKHICGHAKMLRRLMIGGDNERLL